MKISIWKNIKGELSIANTIIITVALALGLGASTVDRITREINPIEDIKIVESINEQETLKTKFNKLKSEYDNIDIKLDEYYVFESVCNGKTQAIVGMSKDKELDKAFEQVESNISKVVERKKYNPIWVKLDVVDKISKEITPSELNKKIAKKGDQFYREGIMFENDGATIALLESEINANAIINYDKDTIDLESLNNYIMLRGYKELKSLPIKFRTFSTISYFCDEENNVYPLYSEGIATGRRKVEELSVNEAQRVVKTATDFLVSQIRSDGTFVYGYYAIEGVRIPGYNNIRHSGTIWALVNCYDENAANSKQCKEAIDKSIEYLNSIICKNTDNIYHIIYSDERLSVGMDALSLVALSEYTKKFNDDTYIDLCKKLGNGIIDLQKEDGRFIHIVNKNSFKTVKEFSTVYYDGEAILGLCKLYGITKDKKYLNAAKKGFDYCIDNDYIDYDDHWLEYCANEITKYTNEEKYYTFGLKNIVHGLAKMKSKSYTSHTDFEKLMQGYELYTRIVDKKIKVDYLSKFPAEEFLSVLKLRSTFQLNSYCYPEVVMYLKNPSRYLGAFYIRGDKYRIRIDDVQHSMTGFYYYTKNF